MSFEPPVATYRLQLHRDFDFGSAAEVAPYLKALGVSHLYLSPIWAATPGSTHGYDVTDHARVNEELGGLAGFYALSRAARDHGLGPILDIVPNHVGIASHPWWRDVLRYGPQSSYASWFDIDWEGQPQQETGVLVYPVLGQPFGSALEAGELTLAYDGSELVVRYFDRTFPIAPRCYGSVLGLPPSLDDAERMKDLAAVLEGLSGADPQAATLLLGRLAEHSTSAPGLRAWIDDQARSFNGQPGEPSTFDRLEALLGQQHYRLAYWRVSAEEINYRRFFDINDLAAIRVEQESVFAATHSLVRDLVTRGMADGLRVDHVDGLYDPGAYLARLRRLVDGDGARGHGIWVEKILAREELLPESWPVEGTTGYDFLAIAGGLFVDPTTVQAFNAIYQDFTGAQVRFDDIAFAAKRRVAGRSFAGEVRVLALHLYRLAQARRLARDNTLGALQDAIATLLAAMPLYRTYLDRDEPMPGDAGLFSSAAALALQRDPNVTPEAMSFLIQVLLLDAGEGSAEERARWVHFRRRFQQLSGPVMAKGVEDTTFFRFHRLLACDEVGDDPGHFGVSASAAHDWFAGRAASWPHALSATTTHDTKRSEDARMRLAALTAVPRAWHRETRAWARTNARHRRVLRGQEVPDRNTEYYIYQSLIASWEGAADTPYIDRMEAHVVKAAREAKLQTSWTRIDEPYEAALRAFVRGILGGRRSPAFVQRLNTFVATIEPIARLNALGLLALKTTAPGIPDFFQGSEFPLHTLTDPDNRQDVDFSRSRSLLREATGARPGPLDPAAKAWLTTRLLALRREEPALFANGGYRPAEFEGPLSVNLFAFERFSTEGGCITIVPHRPAALVGADGHISSPEWEDTWLDLPPSRGWTDWLTGEQFAGGDRVSASALLAHFPVAVLTSKAAARDD